MSHYGMAIDLNRCIGCHTCSMACKMANNLPENVWWNRVATTDGYSMDSTVTEWPHGAIEFVPMSCQHCENPACVKVCPVGATYKDPETGIVRQDYDKCIGCRMCMSACPYTGVRSFNWEEPAFYYDFRSRRCGRARASEARGGEVHLLLPAYCRWSGTGMHAPLSRARSLVGDL